MSLQGTIQSAIPCVLGFDSDTIISAGAAQQFYSQGYKFCIRYIALGPQSDSDLTSGEAAGILAAELALMPVETCASIIAQHKKGNRRFGGQCEL